MQYVSVFTKCASRGFLQAQESESEGVKKNRLEDVDQDVTDDSD